MWGNYVHLMYTVTDVFSCLISVHDIQSAGVALDGAGHTLTYSTAKTHNCRRLDCAFLVFSSSSESLTF